MNGVQDFSSQTFDDSGQPMKGESERVIAQVAIRGRAAEDNRTPKPAAIRSAGACEPGSWSGHPPQCFDARTACCRHSDLSFWVHKFVSTVEINAPRMAQRMARDERPRTCVRGMLRLMQKHRASYLPAGIRGLLNWGMFGQVGAGRIGSNERSQPRTGSGGDRS
jgi:hypothetical protein